MRRWFRQWVAGSGEPVGDHSAEADSGRYRNLLRTIERRLRHEAAREFEDPPEFLHQRTMDAIYRAALARRHRLLPWWETPRFRAALVACGVVLGSCLLAVIAFGPERAPRAERTVATDATDEQTVEPVGGLAGAELASVDDPAPEFDPGVIGSEISAIAVDARRAAEFIAEQFSFRPADEPARADQPARAERDGKQAVQPPGF